MSRLVQVGIAAVGFPVRKLSLFRHEPCGAFNWESVGGMGTFAGFLMLQSRKVGTDVGGSTDKTASSIPQVISFMTERRSVKTKIPAVSCGLRGFLRHSLWRREGFELTR